MDKERERVREIYKGRDREYLLNDLVKYEMDEQEGVRIRAELSEMKKKLSDSESQYQKLSTECKRLERENELLKEGEE